VSASHRPVTGAPLAVVAATRPYPGEQVSGDAWTVEQAGAISRVALVDGLGHGPLAAAAAAAALAALRAQPELGPSAALQACHAALRGTRGAAVSIAAVDATRGRLSFVGVGNVEARVWTNGRVERPIAYRGIVGLSMPVARVVEVGLVAPWALMIHSDGISSRVDPGDLSAVSAGDLQAHADALLATWGRVNDDATLVLVRPA
jgi:serine phosphatase RsbU (regulator of sigma subunit)